MSPMRKHIIGSLVSSLIDLIQVIVDVMWLWELIPESKAKSFSRVMMTWSPRDCILIYNRG